MFIINSRHIVIVCNLEDWKFENLSTSSSRYELDFVLNIAQKVDKVSVVSPKLHDNHIVKNIQFINCDNSNLQNRIRPVFSMVKDLIDSKQKTVVFFWGYNPVMIRLFCKLKSKNTKVVSMIYDTHLGCISPKGVRSFLINRFYCYGMKLVSKLDGVILFNKNAARHLKLKKNYIVVLPGTDIHAIKEYSETDNEKTVFLYSGTLCDYNGTGRLLNAFKKLDSSLGSLRIFGDGPLKPLVESASQKHRNIFYGGRVTSDLLSHEISNADVLLNLRDTDSVVSDFAFPSKLVEYISYGKAVVSTKVSNNEDFYNAVFLLDDLDEDKLLDLFIYLCQNRRTLENKVNNSKLYLEKHHNNQMIFSDIVSFLFGN